MATVTVLLALYNGATHLEEQLESLARQDFQDWSLLVSDDGSFDAGPQIIDAFAARLPRGRVRMISGPRRGSAANFLHLVAQAPDGPVAFCDQDDRWNPDKLSRAMAALETAQGPAIYSARTTICDEDMTPLAGARLFHGPFGFRNALVQCATAGNTIALNASGAALLRAAAPAGIAANIPAHDWFSYQVLTGAGGQVLRDEAEVLLYRQHTENLMGRNDTASAAAARLRMLFDGNYAGWLRRNQAALTALEAQLTPENRMILHAFGAALDMNGPRAAMCLRRLGIYRQTRAGTAALFAATAMGSLRRGVKADQTASTRAL